jgi:hypothetical protein
MHGYISGKKLHSMQAIFPLQNECFPALHVSFGESNTLSFFAIGPPFTNIQKL